MSKTITKEQFLNYYRSEAYSEDMDEDECIEVFLDSLKGSTDITRQLLDTLCNRYQVSLDNVINGVDNG